MSALGITQGEAHVLAHLERSGRTPIGALHHEFGHKRSTLTSIVDRLEARDLVLRELNRDDRRSFIVRLTPAGRRVAGRVTAALDALDRELAGAAATRDLAGLQTIIRALAGIAGGR
jgi:DNA-binding MarR family transcriptional regulator